MADGTSLHQVESQISRFTRTVVAIQGEDQAVKGKFASAALEQLIEIYAAEADLARSEAKLKADNQKLVNWALSVDQYSRHLLVILEDVNTGFPVELYTATSQTVGLTVADRRILLTHPRASQQPAFEQQLLTRLCSQMDCRSLATRQTRALHPAQSLVDSKPVWSFTDAGPVCSDMQGRLNFQYSTARNLNELRLQCRGLLREIALLVKEIRWQQQHGVNVTWSELQILETAQGDSHLIRLNSTGDSVLAKMPTLYQYQRHIVALSPWLMAKASDGTVPIIIIDMTDGQDT